MHIWTSAPREGAAAWPDMPLDVLISHRPDLRFGKSWVAAVEATAKAATEKRVGRRAGRMGTPECERLDNEKIHELVHRHAVELAGIERGLEDALLLLRRES